MSSKLLKCKYCSSVFNSQRSLSQHVKIKHSSRYYSYKILFVLSIILVASFVIYNIDDFTSPYQPKVSGPTFLVSDFNLPIIDSNGISSNNIDSSYLKGKPVIVEFMVSWCPYCENMVPILNVLHSEYGNDINFISIALSWSESDEIETSNFIKKHKPSWIHVFDEENSFAEKYSIDATPTFLIFDKDGSLVKRIEGEISYQDLEVELKNLEN